MGNRRTFIFAEDAEEFLALNCGWDKEEFTEKIISTIERRKGLALFEIVSVIMKLPSIEFGHGGGDSVLFNDTSNGITIDFEFSCESCHGYSVEMYCDSCAKEISES